MAINLSKRCHFQVDASFVCSSMEEANLIARGLDEDDCAFVLKTMGNTVQITVYDISLQWLAEAPKKFNVWTKKMQ